MRSPGPGTRRQAGVGGHPWKLRVVAEHVELPRGGRIGTQHVALKAYAVHQVSNCRFGAGEVCVRFVVSATHHLDTTLGKEPAKVRAVLRTGVPVRLEVIHFSQHELVLGFAAGHFQMGVDQFEAVGLPGLARRVFRPLAGIAGLRVPPDRVVVEVADHEHRPAGLGDGEFKGEFGRVAGTAGVHPRTSAMTYDRTVDGDRNLDDLLASFGDRLAAQTVAVDTQACPLGAPGDGDADKL